MGEISRFSRSKLMSSEKNDTKVEQSSYWVELHVEDFETITIRVDAIPKNEKDLIAYSQYIEFCYKIGLHAPVQANVYRSADKLEKIYSFNYTIRGNSISVEALFAIMNQYTSSQCLEMNVIGKQIHCLYSFSDYDNSFRMYKDLDHICNIGVYHNYDRQSGKYLVDVTFEPV